uniref:Single-stranded DNA binding protein n=1 Tax=Caloglossa intermedia TaxID=100879 RepID=A0A1Z1M5S5_9FLOR|nr:hypothetical protein [Caloglossa intermedia]ARW61438.1 hypothetical protein [Caloglossa intermedia]
MNKYIVTSQILMCTKLKTKAQDELFLILLYIPNNIKGTSFVKILVAMNNQRANNFLKFYQANDICAIEGVLHNIKSDYLKYKLFIKINYISWCRII